MVHAFGVRRLFIALLALAGMAACRDTGSDPRGVGGQMRAAVALDSAATARKLSFDSLINSLADTAPASLDSLRAYYALGSHMLLARLGYVSGPFDANVTPALQEAIRSYQRDRGLTVSGDPLTFELLESLKHDDKAFEVEPILPTKVMTKLQGYVSVTGAWVFETMGRQSIAAEIRCERDTMRCTEVQALLGHNDFGASLTTDYQEWTVERWDQVEIATAPVNFECARYVLRINLVQESATKMRSTISSSPKCGYLAKTDLTITLESGPALVGKRAQAQASAPFPGRLTPAAAAMLNPK